MRTKADALALEQGAGWAQDEADKIIKFAEAFVKPQYINGKFKLLEWQKRFLSNLYAWRWKQDERRRFRFANLHIAKKSGKTLLVSIICMYELLASGEPSPYVSACAASKENASQIFKELKHSIEASPFKEFCQIANHTKRISVPSLNAEFRTFASQGSRIHGEPVSTAVIDECHAIKDVEVYRAIRYNTDARPNGLVVAISTAGNDTSHFYYQQIYSKSKRVLSGDDLDPTFYAEVHEADKESDYEKDETQWYRANPSLGVSFPVDQFRRDLQAAKANLGEWLNFCRLKLNIFVRPDETAWLDVSDWDRYRRDIPEDELKQYDCVVGVDLSEVADPTSVSVVYDLGDRNYYIKSTAWVAEAGLEYRAKTALPKFETFIAAGSMIATPGDMIDRDKVRDHILKLCETYKVGQANFDPHSAYVMALDIENEGYKVARMVQSPRNFNLPMVEFARAYREGRIWHDGSTWLRYCLSNVRVDVNKYGEIRPYKRKCVDFIDGAISTLLAFAGIFTTDDVVTSGIQFV